MQTRKLGNVREKRLIGAAVFESDENFVVHVSNDERPAFAWLRRGRQMTNDETNSKLELRNSKQARNPKFECSKHASVFLDFEFYSFGVVSDFDIRISDLRPTFVLCHFPVTQALMPAQSQRYFPFSKTITAVVIQANVRSQSGETNSPILRRSLVNKTSGMTAKESCRLRMT